MYYSLAPKQIIGVSGKPLAFGTHYDIANYLGHIHEDIAKKYRAEGKNIANTNTIASNIEYALNVIFGINIEDVPITDQIIRATIIENYIPSDLREKILNYKAKYQEILNKDKYSQELGDSFEKDISSLMDSIFSTEKGATLGNINSSTGKEQIKSPAAYDEWMKNIGRDFKIIQKYIEEGVMNKIINNTGGSYKTSEAIREYISFKLDLTVDPTTLAINARTEENAENIRQLRESTKNELENFFNGLEGELKLQEQDFKLFMLNSPGNPLAPMEEVSGKIDVKVSKNSVLIQPIIDLGLNEKSSRLLKGLNSMKGKNFSLKVTNKKKQVKLGHTNFMRVYYDFLPKFSSYGDRASLISGYKHMVNMAVCNRKNPGRRSENQDYYNNYGDAPLRNEGPAIRGETVADRWAYVREEIYVLRVMYELTGYGQNYMGDLIKGSDNSNNYLIYMYFDSDANKNIVGNSFRVMSSGYIFSKIMNKINKGNRIGVGLYNPFHDDIKLNIEDMFPRGRRG